MSRREKGNAINGWLILDKPRGMTSNQALGAVKRLLSPRKAGHAGTLDPLATGVLPIALGDATKTVPYAVDGLKAYRFVVRWGIATDTDDAEGRAIATSEARPSRAGIAALIPRFTGEIMQTPPRFSAIKVAGERAYDLARGGEEVELAARPVVVRSLELVETPDADTAIFEALCGKGTYVRAIARDMGAALGCFGHVTALRRTRVGPFGEAEAITLADLAARAEAGEDVTGPAFVRPVEMALDGIPELLVSPSDAADLALGRAVLIRGRDAPVLSGAMYAMCKGRLVALGEVEKGALHPTRVFGGR